MHRRFNAGVAAGAPSLIGPSSRFEAVPARFSGGWDHFSLSSALAPEPGGWSRVPKFAPDAAKTPSSAFVDEDNG